MIPASVKIDEKGKFKRTTEPQPKDEVTKEDEDLEKYNRCHGARGRFCSGGGGAGGGGGGGLSMETEGARLQPGSGGGGGRPRRGPDPRLGPASRNKPVWGARTDLQPLLGKRVELNAKIDKHSVKDPESCLVNINIKDPRTPGKMINVEHGWVNTPPGHPLRKFSEESKVTMSAVVTKYNKSGGIDFGLRDLQDIKIKVKKDDEDDDMEKGIDVGDVHVAGPGKKRSEMTKEEIEECEKARKREAGCPKVKKHVELFKLDDDQRLIYGVVLVPDVEDLQGDICSKEDIQEAAHDYLVNSRLVKAQHKAPTDAEVVECYIAPVDIPIGKGIAPAGSWVMVTKVNSAAMWTAIKKGDITGYSIGGRGTREEM